MEGRRTVAAIENCRGWRPRPSFLPSSMSRSIHTTRRSLTELRRRTFASDDARREAISEAEFSLGRKRRIKRHVAHERHAAPATGVPTPAAAIPIVVAEEGPYLFHAAAPADVRAVLERLPANAVEGIAEIRVCLGREHMLERAAKTKPGPDPHTGRPGWLLFPGVHCGAVLGTHFSTQGLITLYAYVIDAERLLAPRPIVELYLRLQALKTLMHEVAHFHDHVARVRRGRWLADRHENLERYAEKMEHVWTEEIVVPYLERRYAKECRAFRSWVRQRGGLALSLGFFSGDTRRTERNGLSRLMCPTSGAFEDWLAALPRCASRQDAHLALAWQLHYSDRYEQCLAILDTILGLDPAHVKARLCRADTLVHLERYAEALADADEVIRVAPAENDAWESRADVFEARKDWEALMETCRRWALVPNIPPGKRRELHRYRAIAQCARDDGAGMEASLAALFAAFRFKDAQSAERRMQFIRRSVFRRASRPLPSETSATGSKR